ncbi:MAG TPA: hypothetical protein VGW38_22695 [Chloroflexota bacterium]|nr:hypothetical protein [Chloroflexota bacterium]
MFIVPRLLAADDAHPQPYLPTSMRSHEHEAATGRDPAQPLLTARALLLLQLLARGYTSQQMAALLKTTPKLVDLLIERATHTLGTTDRAEAVAIAVRQGLID